jgi:hypothetical protein
MACSIVPLDDAVDTMLDDDMLLLHEGPMAPVNLEFEPMFQFPDPFLEEPIPLLRPPPPLIPLHTPARGRKRTQRVQSAKTPKRAPKRVRTAYKPVEACTCRKTKCLKLYCVCYRAGRACLAECSCLDCENDVDHAPRETMKPCSCSGDCRRGYCICFRAGRKCTPACNCTHACANCK